MSNKLHLDSIANYVTEMGGPMDPTTRGRPTLDGRLEPDELESLYLQNDIAARIVEEIVEDALGPGLPPLRYAGTKTPVEMKPEAATYLLEQVREAAIASRLWGGGHIFLLLDDNENLHEPVDWTKNPKLLNSFVLDRLEAQPMKWGENAREPGFMLPTHYRVQPSYSGGGGLTSYPAVHESRLLSFRGRRLPRKLRRNNVDYDDSVLQSVWSSIRNFTHSEQSIVNIISRFEIATLSIKGLSEVQSAEEGSKALHARMELLHKTLSVLQLAIIDADNEEKYERRFATLTGLDTLWDRLASSVAKAARMSKTQLFGEGASGIRGDDEAGGKGWRKQVEEFRRANLLPNVLRLVSAHEGRPVEVAGDWGHAESPKPVDAARIGEFNARTAATLIEAGIISADEGRAYVGGQPIEWTEPAPKEEIVPNDPDEEDIPNGT